MNELTPLTIGLIIGAVVLLAVVVVLIVRSTNQRKEQQIAADRERAAELRQGIDRDRVVLQEEELRTHETELAAEQARLDAEKARIDAERLEHEAADRRVGIGESQAELDARLAEADEIDPDVTAEGRRIDDRNVAPDVVDDRDAVVDRAARADDRIVEQDVRVRDQDRVADPNIRVDDRGEVIRDDLDTQRTDPPVERDLNRDGRTDVPPAR